MCVDKGSDLMPIGEVIKDTGNDIICPRRKIQLKNGATMERMSDSFRLFCIVEVCEDYPCEMVKTEAITCPDIVPDEPNNRDQK